MKSKWKGIYSVRNPQIIEEGNVISLPSSDKTVGGLQSLSDAPIGRTHIKRPHVVGSRSWVILPEWVGKTVKIHTGNDWKSLIIENKHIGYKIGEFAITKKQPIYKRKTTRNKK